MPKTKSKKRWRGFGSMSEAEQTETARMGGNAVVKKYGSGHMRDIAKAAVRARRKKARAAAATFGSRV